MKYGRTGSKESSCIALCGTCACAIVNIRKTGNRLNQSGRVAKLEQTESTLISLSLTVLTLGTIRIRVRRIVRVVFTYYRFADLVAHMHTNSLRSWR